MIVCAWRLVRANRAEHAFSGEGARLYGGRWNPPGLRATYLSGSRALAALEVLVHEAERIPASAFLFFEARFPSEFVREIHPDEIAGDWRGYPPKPNTTGVGEEWIRSQKTPVLRVPSILIPEEANYLINPEHPRANEIEVRDPRPFRFDPRFSAK